MKNRLECARVLHVFLVVLMIWTPVFTAEAAADYAAGGVSFTRPVSWQEAAPSSNMRLYEFHASGAAGASEDAQLAVFYFGMDQGGAVDANIDRWKGQFSDLSEAVPPRAEEETVSGMNVTTVRIEGTFQSGMPMGPSEAKENYGLLGAIVEGPQGPVFFKFTGPKEVIRANESAFNDLVQSFKPSA